MSAVLMDDNDGCNKGPLSQQQQLLMEAFLSKSLLHSMRKRSLPPPLLLDLQKHLYDVTTGLHSEGVWHNAMVGIASLSLLQLQKKTKEEKEKELENSKKIADSLWKYSWDGISFRRRAYSGLWDHEKEILEQPNYYKESNEHRSIQHGISIVFWSMLVRTLKQQQQQQGSSSSNDDDSNDLCRHYEEQFHLMAKSYMTQFWNDSEDRWHTVSKCQGGGTVSRPSASMGKSLFGTKKCEKDEWKKDNRKEDVITKNPDDSVEKKEKQQFYYRAVDQAVGILACVSMLPLFKQQKNYRDEYEGVVQIIRRTASELLSSPKGFRYGNDDDDDARSYIGISRNRNFWHDGWVLLSLVCARDYIWQDDEEDAGENVVRTLFERLMQRYGHLSSSSNTTTATTTTNEMIGTVWHWSTSQKNGTENGNVHYCGDNALLYAIAQTLDWAPGEGEGGGKDELDTAFWKLVDLLRSRDDDKLASVADAYPQVCLHPNTELAALVLWRTWMFL